MVSIDFFYHDVKWFPTPFSQPRCLGGDRSRGAEGENLYHRITYRWSSASLGQAISSMPAGLRSIRALRRACRSRDEPQGYGGWQTALADGLEGYVHAGLRGSKDLIGSAGVSVVVCELSPTPANSYTTGTHHNEATGQICLKLRDESDHSVRETFSSRGRITDENHTAGLLRLGIYKLAEVLIFR